MNGSRDCHSEGSKSNREGQISYDTMVLVVKNLPAYERDVKMWVQSLGQEDLLEEGIATPRSVLAWRIPWTEEPCELQSIGSQAVGHN